MRIRRCFDVVCIFQGSTYIKNTWFRRAKAEAERDRVVREDLADFAQVAERFVIEAKTDDDNVTRWFSLTSANIEDA